MLDDPVNRHYSFRTEKSQLEFDGVLFSGGGSMVEDEPGDLFVVPVRSLTLSVEFTLKAHDYIGLFHYRQDYRLKLSLTQLWILLQVQSDKYSSIQCQSDVGQQQSVQNMPKEPFDTKPWVTQYVSEQEVMEIKMAFDLFDLDLGGSIDPKELREAIASLGIEAKAAAVYQMIAELDSDGSGSIQFDEFYAMMTHKPNEQQSRQQIHKIFIMFDINKTGFIGLKELRKVSKELGELADDYFLQEMIQRADLDGDNLISEEQFYNLMTKKAF